MKIDIFFNSLPLLILISFLPFGPRHEQFYLHLQTECSVYSWSVSELPSGEARI